MKAKKFKVQVGMETAQGVVHLVTLSGQETAVRAVLELVKLGTAAKEEAQKRGSILRCN